jgi:nucleotide-binding universal stress UspA family protein
MVTQNGKILVGYDGSGEARAALAFAEGYARLMSGHIVLAHVEGLGPYDLPASGLIDAAHERAEHELAKVAAEVTERGVRAEARPVVFGSPARGLQTLAAGERPELVVVGASHRGRVGTALVGTVAIRLLHGTPCPIAVAPKHQSTTGWKPETIGLAYDGSPGSALALAHAARVARAANASLQVLAVAESWSTPAVELPVDVSAVRTQTRERAETWLREAGQRLEEDGKIAVSGTVLEGDPPHALAQASGSLDLLLLGSRAFGPVKRVLLGSVASHVLGHAACPVIVTPQPTQAQAAA